MALGFRDLRKSVGRKQVTLQEIKPAPTSPLSGKSNSPSVSAYSFFYPEAVREAVMEEEDRTAEMLERAVLRQKKKAFFADNITTFELYKSSNLSTIHTAFTQFASSEGTVNRETYTQILLSLGVTDGSVIDRTFDLFDGRKEGTVDYKEIVSALNVIINGTNRKITYQACFALFDTAACGYIIKNCLQEMKELRQETDGTNHLMVKTLIEIIDRLQEEDADKYKKDWLKRNKRHFRRKPKNDKKTPSWMTPTPQSHVLPPVKKKKDPAGPVQFQKKIHLSYEEFCAQMGTNPMLVQAFLTTILLTMENVYMRNKRSAERTASQSSGLQPLSGTTNSATVPTVNALGAPGGGSTIAASSVGKQSDAGSERHAPSVVSHHSYHSTVHSASHGPSHSHTSSHPPSSRASSHGSSPSPA